MSSTITERQRINSSSAVKVPCKAATTANITLSGEQTIDGVSCVTNDRVLVKDQTTSSENGIYICNTSTWSRARDWDGAYDVKQGTFVYVHSGSTNTGFWYVTTSDTITPGTTSVTIAQASSVLATISAFAQTLLDDADAAAVLTTLGVSAYIQTLLNDSDAGTARTTLAAAADAEVIHNSLLTTTGDLVYASGASTPARLSIGTAGFVPRSSGTIPAWAAPAAVLGDHKNLVVANDGTNPNYQIDITADEIVLKNSSNGAFLATSVSETVDITASGANGLDTGAESSGTWYYIWIIAKEDGTVDSLLSASSTAPTLPSGYTYKALVGAVRNDGSSNFLPFEQQDKRVVYTTNQAILDGALSAAAWTAVAITSYYPATAKSIKVAFGCNGNSAGLSPYSSGAGGEYFFATNTGGASTFGGVFTTGRNAAYACSILYKSSIYYYTASAVNGTLMATGWEY